MSLVCSLAVAATVYKWVDEHGVVHYSDQPHPNAQKMSVQAVQTYKAGDMPATPGGPPAPPDSASPPPYQGCAIAQPAEDQTFANVDALTVIVRTDPQGNLRRIPIDFERISSSEHPEENLVLLSGDSIFVQ